LPPQAGLGEDTEIASGLIVSCIVGGAIVTPLMGAVSDSAGSINVAYVVPMTCFAGVGVYSRRASARSVLAARGRVLGEGGASAGLKATILGDGAP
jgi:fucose permease